MNRDDNDRREELIAAALAGELSPVDYGVLDRLRASDPSIDTELAEAAPLLPRLQGVGSWDAAPPSAVLGNRIRRATADTDSPVARRPGRPRRRVGMVVGTAAAPVAVAVAAAVVLIDQATKTAALTGLSQYDRIPLVGDLFGLQLAFNPGAIFSLGSDVTWLLTILTVVAVVLLGRAAARARTTGWAAGIGFILGGAIGNLIDRLFSPPGFGRGAVTDFLNYGDLFIGNLADVALGVGALVLAGSTWARHRRADTRTAALAHRATPRPAGGER